MEENKNGKYLYSRRSVSYTHLDETSQGVEGKTIAKDGIAVVVNNDNSVDELSTDQVKSIFTGETTSWSDVSK